MTGKHAIPQLQVQRTRFERANLALLDANDSDSVWAFWEQRSRAEETMDSLLADIGWWSEGYLVYPWEVFGENWHETFPYLL